ncbi:MAG: hypothetical protein EOO90_24550 [Pedobacter sp.]|nr:MAG: hypothetical protein EOO90_24550 [Pedobacter sp.]
MEQNNMWMRFLVLGAFSLFFVGFSCKHKGFERDGEYVYINSTNHAISFFTPHFNSFSLLGRETHVIQLHLPAGKTIGPETFVTPFNNNNTLILQFDGNKCLTMTNTSENSILNMYHYTAEKISSRAYKFTYTFTEADYNRATACP